MVESEPAPEPADVQPVTDPTLESALTELAFVKANFSSDPDLIVAAQKKAQNLGATADML